jgi:hypothetical protein
METSWNTKFCGPGAGKTARVRAGSEFEDGKDEDAKFSRRAGSTAQRD